MSCHCRGNGLTQPHKGLDVLLGMLDDIVRQLPAAWLPKDDDRRTAKTEIRLLCSALERPIKRMNLNDAANGHRADFNERHISEVLCRQDANIALVHQLGCHLCSALLPKEWSKGARQCADRLAFARRRSNAHDG